MRGGAVRRRPDDLAVEEPLEVRCASPGSAGTQTLSVTMRTPGHDFELAAGWLNSEAVVSSPAEILAVKYCTDPDVDGKQRYNIVTVELVPEAIARARPRATVTSSSCGICGSASIESVQLTGHPSLGEGPVFDWSILASLPDLLRSGQGSFARTGGMHGAAAVSQEGEVLVAREDIGRHNAVDKVIGWAMLNGRFPLSGAALVVSGRSSFEIVQKALRAGIGLVAGVSAASSLAVALARSEGLTLVGWLRGDRATVYSCPERLRLTSAATAGSSSGTASSPGGRMRPRPSAL